jgi:16S rRNA (cytosine1402-N4)-methyltransferase
MSPSPAAPVMSVPSDSSPIPFVHVTVLRDELVQGVLAELAEGGCYLDATLGGGGHSLHLLETNPTARLIGLDQDEAALSAAADRLAAYADRVTLIHSNFDRYDPGSLKFDGIMADLGVSSAQLDQADRGFSFRYDAPLDMRMDRSQGRTAAELVNHCDEAELATILYTYGEERLSRRIARAIVEGRPINTTGELVEAIRQVVPDSYRNGRISPATRTFQGLRIAVNRELDALETFLAKAPTWLTPRGKIGVISFHSLEDRLVKHRLKESDRLEVLTKKPILPGDGETRKNPRSRSAKLRIAQCCEPGSKRGKVNRYPKVEEDDED